jgi:predicted transcriptional regulator
MGMMKNMVLPILEVLAEQPGTRMDIFFRLTDSDSELTWSLLKRIISGLRADGLVKSDGFDVISLTPEGRAVVQSFEE